MSRFFIILIACLFVNAVLAQHTVSGIITDNDNNLLAFANIGVMDSNLGTVSDNQGRFEIKVNSKNDTLVFSYLGYHTKKLAVGDVLENNSVALEPNAYLIDEIEITSSNFSKDIILGEQNKKDRGNSVSFGNAQLGSELGALIRIEKETLIKSVNFVLNHAKGDSLLLRVNIYDYTDNKIGEKILRHNVFIKDKQRKGLFTIDLEAYDLILNNDVLLSLEWLKNYDEAGNKQITFDTKKSKNLKGIYVRYSKTSDFIKLAGDKNRKPCIFFVGQQKES